jgi:hypothetical protein
LTKYDPDRVTLMLNDAQAAVVTVGTGRGFVMQTAHERLILTTANCLPHLSHPDAGSDFRDRTFFDLLGPLQSDPTVSAECLFVDPVADVAVLGEPKSLLDAEKDAYRALVETSGTLRIGVLTTPCEVWLLTLEGRWERCRVRTSAVGRALTVVGANQGLAPGTSGSPILNPEGAALGIVSVCAPASDETVLERQGQPLLGSVLPVWLFTASTQRPAQEQRQM